MTTSTIKLILKDKYHYDISDFSVPFFEKIVLSRMTSLKYITMQEYETELLYNQEEVKTLIDSLQIPFTFFFRDSLSFELLSSTIIPDLIRKIKNGREIRVWSVGCSAGQEPYSLAMTFEEIAIRYNKSIPYRIFASDISEDALAKAKNGKYLESEIGNIRHGYLSKYFVRNKNEYEVISRIKDRIHFGFYNLLDDSRMGPDESIYASFDIVMCSNVLYYYQENVQTKMLQKLFKTINPGGYFITSETEKYLVKVDAEIESSCFQSSVFHKVKRGD